MDDMHEPLAFIGAQAEEPEPEPEDVDPRPLGGGELLPATFLRQLVRRISDLSADRGWMAKTEARGRLAKVWFGRQASIHYEVWLHDRTLQLELGLHCESSAEYNRALYREFDAHLVEIQAELGTAFWLEEWDHGWIRLYETHRLRPLNVYRVEEVADRLMEIITVLEPIYKAISAKLPAPPDVSARRSA